MASPALVLAAQTNGRKSKGPVTAAGKQKSAGNSRRHGLFSKEIRTDAECDRHFQELRAMFSAAYQPATEFERAQVETLALAEAKTWWAIRTYMNLINQAMAATAESNEPIEWRQHRAHEENLAAVDRLMRLFGRFRRTYWLAWDALQHAQKMKE